MNYLIQVTPILNAIPNELYPSINDGYEYGVSRDVVVSEEEYFCSDPRKFQNYTTGCLARRIKKYVEP